MRTKRRLLAFLRRRERAKVFCVGYNKTGTTTLERVLIDLGYRMPDQMKQESLVVEPLFKGNYRPLFELCKKYDAFQDLPFSQEMYFIALDASFPGSKFILTIRDPNSWFESLVRFHLNGILARAGIDDVEKFGEQTFQDKSVYLHKNYLQNVVRRQAAKVVGGRIELDWSLVYNKQHRVRLYEDRNRDIVTYFQNRPDQLLVIDLTKENDNSKIVSFLGLPENLVKPLPHLNKSQ
jgi:hypothetical protein